MALTPDDLPEGWINFDPWQKIDWFNANQVDEGTLRNYASQADIDWMKGQGYQGSYEPIETEAVTGVRPGALASVTPQPVYTPEPVFTPTADVSLTPSGGGAFESVAALEPVVEVPAAVSDQAIVDWFANNPSEFDTVAAMVRHGVTEADVERATGKTLQELYPSVSDQSGGASSTAVSNTSGALPVSTDAAGTSTKGALTTINNADAYRYTADLNAGQYVFDPLTGKHKLLSADQVYNNVEIPTFTDRTVYQGGGEDAGTFESAAQQLAAWKAEQDRRAALTPAQRAIEDARYDLQGEGSTVTAYNTVIVGGKEYTVTGDGSTLVRVSDNQSGLGAKQTRYDMLDPVTGQITQEIGVEGPGLLKSFLTNPVTGLILGLALPGVGSAIGSALGATGAAAGALGSGVLNFGLQVAAGADPIDALKGAVLSAGAGFAGAQVSSMLPAELASAGKSAVTQLITTGKLDPAALATSVGTSFATDALAAETGVDKATASKLVTAGLQALQGNELAALTSLAQAGLSSGLSSTGVKPAPSSQDRAAFLEANAAPLGLSALSPNPTEDQLIDFESRTNAANQLLTDYTASGSDISRDNAIARLTSLGMPATRAQELITNADSQVEQRRVASDVMNRYSKIDPEFGTPQLDRQTAIGEMVAAGMSSERANDLLNGVDAQNAIKLENKLGVQAAYQNLLTGKGSEDALRSAMTSAGYADADINDTVTRARGVIEGGKLTSGEQVQMRAENLPDVRADIAAKSTFNEAYALAREKLGAGATFTWQGKPYSTATFQEDPKLGLVPVAGSGRGEAAGKTVEQEAAYENTRQQLAAAAAKPSGLISNIGSWLSNQMKISSEAAQNYLKNNPNSPITQSVSTAYDAAGELLSNVAGGTALLLNNKPLADEFIRGGGELQKFGQSIGTGPQDTANFNDTMKLLSAAQGPQEKLAVLAGRILDGTSGLARQTVIELRQELPALFLGGAGARAAMVASGLIDTADTAGNAAIGAYDDAVRSGKTHDQALLDARKAGAAAGATEAAIQLTIGKLGDFAVGKLDNVAGKATGKVLGEGVTEGGQEAGASAAVDLALGQSVDVNKALTQGIIGSAIGKSTALSTTPVDVATSDAASTFNNTLAQTGNVVQASTGSVTTAINNGLAPGAAVSTVIDAAAKSGGDMSAVITASINTGLSTALSSGANASTAVSTIVAGSVTASLNNGVDASMAVSSTVGSSVKTGIANGVDASAVVASSVNSAVSTALSSGASASTVVTGAVNSAVTSGLAAGANASTVIASSVTAAVSTATQSGANSTAVVTGSTSTAVSTAIASGVDASTAVGSTVTAVVDSAIANGGAVSSTITAAVGSSITAGVQAGGNMASVVGSATSSAITSAVSGGATVEAATVTAVNSAISTGIKSGGDASAVITAAVGSAITSSNGDAEAVSSSLQTAASTALSAGASATDVTTATINAAVAGGVNATTAASSTIAGVVAAGGNLQQAVTAAETATGVKVITSQTDGKTVITSTDANTVTKTVVDPASNVTITSTTDLTTNKTTTTIADTGVQQQIDALQQSVADINTNLSTAINDAVKSGKTGDAALQTAIDKVASDLGVTKTDLLSQIGKTESALKNQFTTQLGDVSTSLNAAIQSAIAQGKTADTALTESISKVASDLGLTKDQLLQQIGKTETALKSDVKTLSDTVTKINTDLSTEIKSVLKTTQDADAVLNTSINKVASDLGITKDQLLNQIGKTESQLKSEIQTTQDTITQVKTDLTTEIYNAAKTSADADKIISESIQKVADDLGVTKEELLDQIGETELTLKAELSTELAKVSQELGKQIKGIKTGLANQAALAAASQVFRGAGSPEDWLGGKLLAAKQTGGYQDPLAQFQALQEDAQRMELLQQVAPELADVLTERGMPLPHYSYGEEPSMDEILGFSSDESSGYNQEPEFKAGGRVSPLNIQMMYAKGGHTREDFRDGKHVAGPGDGQSDDIPAWLADGEFVFPADVVSALGNGSTKAGTEKLYEMMHEIRSRARSKHPKDLPPPALKSPLDYLKYRK